MKIFYDEVACVKCLACLSESERGGVIYEHSKIIFDATKQEDWNNIAAICPVAAITVVRDKKRDSKR